MATCLSVKTATTFTVEGTQNPQTCGYVVYTRMEVDSFQPVNINPVDAAYVFSWGVGAVLLLWSFGFAVGAASRVVNKA